MLPSLGFSAQSGLKLGPSQEEPEETLKLKLSVIRCSLGVEESKGYSIKNGY